MDVSRIISDAGAFSILNRAKSTDDSGPKVQEKQAPEKAELKPGEGQTSSELVVQIIQDADELSAPKDTLEKSVEGKGQFIDKKV